ncbi:MAG: hypothetical protein JSS24_07115 [Proteobacteria bacterium]|nr:hypothetical protein [Pseudomonadota bacterium]
MSAAAALRVDYLPLARLAQQPSPWWRGVLGVVGFESAPPLNGMAAAIPVTASGTPLLGSDTPLCEVWQLADPDLDGCRVDCSGHVRYRHGEPMLFGCASLDETEARRDGESPAATLRRVTELAYRDIFRVMEHSGYPHLIRVWHYLPDINAECDGDERYRHFNSARHSAFAQASADGAGVFPAASALGSRQGSAFSIHFLAARCEPVMIENPRQISAYHYPRQYGEHCPLFSRACILGTGPGAHLFVSGTASIIGHETIHSGDEVAQTRETLTNIAALLEQANRRAPGGRFDLDALKYKVYVRHRRDQPAIAAELGRWLQAQTAVVYLEADVCREDLLVEIEAIGTAGASV